MTQTNITSLFGGRTTFQVGDFVEIGAQVMDASNGNTLLDMFNGDLVAGSLTAGQSTAPLTAIAVILSDDSPDDNEGGAALFSHDVQITSRDFDTGRETVYTLQTVSARSQWPVIFAGLPASGFFGGGRPSGVIANYDFNESGLCWSVRRRLWGGFQLRAGQRL